MCSQMLAIVIYLILIHKSYIIARIIAFIIKYRRIAIKVNNAVSKIEDADFCH